MQKFNDILAILPSVDHVQAMELLNADGGIAAVIENKPGSSGSVRVYHHLWQKWGCINTHAAKEGLSLYAEHTQDARNHPGKHPNIDRLFKVIENNGALSIRVIPVELS